MTWNSCMHSPSIITMLYSMGLDIHMHGECMSKEQSRIGISNERDRKEKRWIHGLATVVPKGLNLMD